MEQGRETSARNSYFPLTVGNWWTLRCSSEGEFQFEKTLHVTSDSTVGGTPFFRVEQTTTSDAKPLVFYLFQTTKGIVSKTFVPGRDSAAPLVRSTMSVGDRAGALTAARTERVRTPATGDVEVIQLETFSLEDANLTAERRLEWLGRSYAKGIGPVIEADAMGNECVLVHYHVLP